MAGPQRTCGTARPGAYKWYFGHEETVLILAGEVHVTSPAGDTHVLGPGSVGYFPSGTWWVWQVPTHVRKLSFNRRSVPWPARVLGRVWTGVMRRFGR